MSLNSQVFPGRSNSSESIRHLFLKSEAAGQDVEYDPHIYVEARIDFTDIRSGYNENREISYALEMGVPLDADMHWTEDMIRAVDPARIETGMPESAKLRNLPVAVNAEFFSRIETQFLSYLMRHTSVKVFRNFALSLYSVAGETEDEFRARCIDRFNEFFRRDLDALRDIVNRRLEHFEKRWVNQRGVREFMSEPVSNRARGGLHVLSERIADLFLHTRLALDPQEEALPVPDPSLSELAQRLAAIEAEVRREIGRLLRSYREKACNVDEYILHPNIKDLHLVRTCILWMPVPVSQK